MIVEQNLHLLRQGLALLSRLGEDLYRASDDASSPVGAHVRHIVDYYHCFLNGLGARRIDYDARARDPRLETDPAVAMAALEVIVRRLEALDEADFPSVLEIKVDTPEGTPYAWNRSSLARELQFLVSHTVHHYALIGFLLRRHGVEPAADFGVAPSTLRHRSILTAGAR